jgi:hypothetical protein
MALSHSTVNGPRTFRARRADRRVLKLPAEPDLRRAPDRLRGGPGASGGARRCFGKPTRARSLGHEFHKHPRTNAMSPKIAVPTRATRTWRTIPSRSIARSTPARQSRLISPRRRGVASTEMASCVPVEPRPRGFVHLRFDPRRAGKARVAGLQVPRSTGAADQGTQESFHAHRSRLERYAGRRPAEPLIDARRIGRSGRCSPGCCGRPTGTPRRIKSPRRTASPAVRNRTRVGCSKAFSTPRQRDCDEIATRHHWPFPTQGHMVDVDRKEAECARGCC